MTSSRLPSVVSPIPPDLKAFVERVREFQSQPIASVAKDAVGTANLGNGVVATAKIASGAVVAEKIAKDAITTDKLINGGVTTDKLINGGVTTDKLAAGAVTADKLAVGAVTPASIGAAPAGGSLATNWLCNDLRTASGSIYEQASGGSITGSIDLYNTSVSNRMVFRNAAGFQFYTLSSDTPQNVYVGGISAAGSILPATRGAYDLGSPTFAFNALLLAAESASLGLYNHTAVYTSADGFKIRTATLSGSTWSFSDTLKPLFSSDTGHTSNRRLKRDIEPLTGARATLKATTPIFFRMNADQPGSRRRVGLVAEDLEAVFPEAVIPIGDTFEEDGAPVKAVLLMPLITEVIQAFKEQDDMLETLTSQVGALSEALTAATRRLAALELALGPIGATKA